MKLLVRIAKFLSQFWKSGILAIVAGLFLWKILHLAKDGADEVLPVLPTLTNWQWLNFTLYAIFAPIFGGGLMWLISLALRHVTIGRGGREALLLEPVGSTGYTRKKLVIVNGEKNIDGRPHWVCERPHLISILTGNAEFVDKDDPFFKFTGRSAKECFKSYGLRLTDLPDELIREKKMVTGESAGGI